MKKIIFFSFFITGLIACKNDAKPVEETANKTDYTEVESKAKVLFGTLPAVAENPENPFTEAKVALGKKLYFDVRLSKDNTISCNSCHNLETYGVDNLPVSPGNDKGTFGNRNSPTTLNAALHIAQFWDGRNKDVEEQAGGPILNPVEMAIHDEKFLTDRLSKLEEYRTLFAQAFPDDKNPIQYKNIQKAIGAFERKLITPSKFDDFLAGNSAALTDEEKQGLKTFMDVGCTSCHIGNVLGGNMYQKFGLFGNYWEATGSKVIDEGKYTVTKNESDKYVFKVPTLRNVEKTYPYFHDGSVADLNKAVQIMGTTQLGKTLTDAQVAEIVTFLKTLTGEVAPEYKQAASK